MTLTDTEATRTGGPSHPLDNLSADEIDAARELLVAAGLVSRLDPLRLPRPRGAAQGRGARPPTRGGLRPAGARDPARHGDRRDDRRGRLADPQVGRRDHGGRPDDRRPAADPARGVHRRRRDRQGRRGLASPRWPSGASPTWSSCGRVRSRPARSRSRASRAGGCCACCRSWRTARRTTAGPTRSTGSSPTSTSSSSG